MNITPLTLHWTNPRCTSWIDWSVYVETRFWGGKFRITWETGKKFKGFEVTQTPWGVGFWHYFPTAYEAKHWCETKLAMMLREELVKLQNADPLFYGR